MANIRRYGKNGRIKGVDIDPNYLKKFNIIDSEENSDSEVAEIGVNTKNNATIIVNKSDNLCVNIDIKKNAENLCSHIIPELVEDIICEYLGIDKLINMLGGNEEFIRRADLSIYEYISYVACKSAEDITIHIEPNSLLNGGNYIEFPVDNNVVAVIHFNEEKKLCMVTISTGSPNAHQYEYNQTLAFFRKMKFIDIINQLF